MMNRGILPYKRLMAMSKPLAIVPGVEIVTPNYGGFTRIFEGPNWTLATIGYSDKFAEEHFTAISRHLRSDEAFVLLQGMATLVIGMDLSRIEMTPFACYNVKAGTWHQLLVSPDARLIVVENSDTSKENTETIAIK